MTALEGSKCINCLSAMDSELEACMNLTMATSLVAVMANVLKIQKVCFEVRIDGDFTFARMFSSLPAELEAQRKLCMSLINTYFSGHPFPRDFKAILG